MDERVGAICGENENISACAVADIYVTCVDITSMKLNRALVNIEIGNSMCANAIKAQPARAGFD